MNTDMILLTLAHIGSFIFAGEVVLALAKVAGLFMLLSHTPTAWKHWAVGKHPILCDLFCMLIVPLPFILFGGVHGVASAVYFALCMSMAIKVYRWTITKDVVPTTFVVEPCSVDNEPRAGFNMATAKYLITISPMILITMLIMRAFT